ncbi:MAG: RNA polymerase sigma-70 factor [Bacteroidetes bacterium]|nr:RNA polymerase sigma-70 factor [Bacteroidota bacterium]MCY4206069.1 RNA polymerase sigma-70 factor [Bacteroidota bacterium]
MQRAKPEPELNSKEKRSTSLTAKLSQISRRLAQSDRDAFRELFEEVNVILIRFCWRFTKDNEASQDIVQDVFVKIWDKRDTLDPDRSLLALMYTMVRNRALNLSRDSHYSDGVDADEVIIEHTPGPDDQVDFDMLEGNVRKWIDDLPPRRRQAFKLSRFEGLTHAEIAEIMNLTPRTVNTHVMLALRDLRLKLQALHKDSHTHAHRS